MNLARYALSVFLVSYSSRHQQPRRALRLIATLVALAALRTTAAAEDLVGLYLTWTHDPTTTMTVNWVDIYADSSRTVWYRPFKSKEWSQAQATQSTVGPTTMPLRRVELTGLEPDALYEFGIGDTTGDVSHFWRFRTMPAKLDRPVTFVEGGDMMHTRAMIDAMNARMQQLEPDFAMFVGDLAYANGVTGTRWIDWLQSMREFCVTKDKRIIPLVVGIGNHEIKKDSDGKPPGNAPYFYSLFPRPTGLPYYALDFGDYLSLVLLDSGHSLPIEGLQTEWLEHALAERAGQQFLFAGYHFPAYGTTKAPSGGLPIDHELAVALQKNWTPLFDRFGLSAVFEHDHHNFKRTHRLRNRQRDDRNGILYLGDGSWGVRPREVPSPEVGWWLAKAAPRNHLWHVELRPEGAAALRAIDAAGEVFDQVDLAQPRTAPVP
jgi:hypothetical protein